MTEQMKKYSFVFDTRFLQVIELSIMGAVDGKAFGDVFKSLHTADNVHELTAEIDTAKLAMLFDHFIRLFSDGDRKNHELILSYLNSFRSGEYKADELLQVFDSNGKSIQL